MRKGEEKNQLHNVNPHCNLCWLPVSFPLILFLSDFLSLHHQTILYVLSLSLFFPHLVMPYCRLKTVPGVWGLWKKGAVGYTGRQADVGAWSSGVPTAWHLGAPQEHTTSGHTNDRGCIREVLAKNTDQLGPRLFLYEPPDLGCFCGRSQLASPPQVILPWRSRIIHS